jgi:hypothetical protein
MKAPGIDPGLRELLGLSLLALGGCTLALSQGHLLFERWREDGISIEEAAKGAFAFWEWLRRRFR